MVGRLLTLSSGVRQLHIEAGWPRVPRDGVVRGGGLARANIRHFGIKDANESLLLVTSKGVPRWVSLDPPRDRSRNLRVSIARAHHDAYRIVKQKRVWVKANVPNGDK